MKFLALTTIFLTTHLAFSQYTGIHSLDSTVVRIGVLTANGGLLGTKGDKGGTGYVYRMDPLGNWEILNNGNPLSESVEDIQAVAEINKNTYLAGTWKNGLFRSDDSGAAWKLLSDFPAKDIRCIQVGEQTGIIYAATTTHGIMHSRDQGNTWSTIGPDSLFRSLASWSIELDPENDSIIYAMTFGRKIMKSFDCGLNWEMILDGKENMIYDLHINREANMLWATGSGDSTRTLQVSFDKGETWVPVNDLPDASLNEVATSSNGELFIGSWDKGVFALIDEKWNHVDEIPFPVITDICIRGKVLTVFTWGHGVYELTTSP